MSSSSSVHRPLPRKYDSTVWSETLAVVVGAIGSLVLRAAITQLSHVNSNLEGSSRASTSTPPSFWLRNLCAENSPVNDDAVCSSFTSAAATAALAVWNILGVIGSILSRVILWFLPHIQSSHSAATTTITEPSSHVPVIAVGFSLANIWWLLWIRKIWRCYANLPTRVSEVIMGRLSWRRFCFLVLPIHLLATMAIAWSGQELLEQLSKHTPSASTWSQMALAPIIYSSHTPWWTLLLRETLVTTIFVVSTLVLPELLRVNRLPVWPCGFIFYPLYSYSLDARRQPSTFQPVLLLAFTGLATIQKGQLLQYWNIDWIIAIAPNLVGSLLGGWVAGRIMRVCFPDGPKQR